LDQATIDSSPKETIAAELSSSATSSPMLKIVEHSAATLTLRQNRLSFRRLLGELMLTGVGLGFLLWFGPAKLQCQRLASNQIYCLSTKPGWLGWGNWRNQPIPNLQGVKLTRHVGEDDGGLYYQILLQTNQGEMPLRSYQTGGWDNNQESTDRIQSFLQNPAAQQLRIEQLDWCQWFGLVSGMGFLFMGGRLLYISLLSGKFKSIESYDFDQSKNKLTYRYGGLLRQCQENYALSDIKKIILDLDPWAKARLFLELRSGEVLCLNGQVYSIKQPFGQGEEWQPLQVVANQVSQQVHLPWQLTVGFGQIWMSGQLTQNKYTPAIKRAWPNYSQLFTMWVFERGASLGKDRSAGFITYHPGETSQVYHWQDVVDVQVVPASESNTTSYRDDGRDYYLVEYQTNLLLCSGESLLIQKFLVREDYWNLAIGKPPTAKTWAEESAQCIRQFMQKTES
jgi:hypothetical protein